MDLNSVSDTEKLLICRKYFFGGIFCLPFVWLINSIWFFKLAFQSKYFPEQAKIKQYVIGSMIGTSLWIIGITVWIIKYQLSNRDSEVSVLTLNIPQAAGV